MAKISTSYESNDGKKFATALEADAHDMAVAMNEKIVAYTVAAGLGKAETTRALNYISGFAAFNAANDAVASEQAVA